MKKVLSSILISFIIFVNLLAPFSVGWGKNGVEVKKNEANAENQIDVQVTTWTNSNTIRVNVAVKWESNNWFTKQIVQTEVRDMNGSLIENKEVPMTDSPSGNNNQGGYVDFTKNITANTQYKIYTSAVQAGSSVLDIFSIPGTPDVPNVSISGKPTPDPLTITTEPEGNTKTLISSGKQTSTNAPNMPPCGIDSGDKIMGCIAQSFYYVIFVPTSYLFALSGVFFDSTFAYSVQDTSYRSVFVVQGWGLVRDICNLFFIFVLLYVAIGTTLSLHSMKTKETIINVVIIGLFINFSLFATQVIIDASNITARVFYNSDAIKLDEKGGANGVAEATPGLTIGADGVIPLSAGLVNKINPQNLILKSKEINNIPDKGQASNTDEGKKTLSISSFILVVLLASAVNIVGFIVFLSVGMMFVARIVGLWIAMILAPLAFFTYILPEQMAGIKMIGWKNWWPETLKLAFLAPVFMFFMYLILKFLSIDLISDIAGKGMIKDGLGYFISILMPFAFIMFLLIKAKGIAKDMSGEMGATFTKFGESIGGAALGGAVGLGAMAMRGTLGRFGNNLSQNETLKAAEAKGGLKGFGARMLLKGGEKAGAGSFDARNTKAGAAAGKGLGVDMGKAKEGGYTKMKADQIAAAQKRAKELELGENSHEKQELNKADAALKGLQNEWSHDIQTIEGKLKGARQRKADAAIGSQAEKDAIAEIKELTAEKSNITAGGKMLEKDRFGNTVKDAQDNDVYKLNDDGTTRYHTTTGRISEDTIATDIEKATKAEKARVDAVTAKNTIATEAEQARNDAVQMAINNRNDTVAEATLAATQARNTAKTTAATAAQSVIDAENDAVTAETLATTNATAENVAAANIARATANSAANDAAKNIKNTEQAALDAEARVATTITKADAIKMNAIKEAEKIEDEKVQKAEDEVVEATRLLNEAGAKAAISVADGNTAGTNKGRSMNDLEYKDIPDAHHHLEKANNTRKNNIANNLESADSKIFNMIVSGGEYSRSGANQAAHAIRMDVKTEGSGH